ncbi:hypothetical protein SUNI508_06440 [Seiridium unicorne]|uniref:Uncharacterized protein n=1 Tax=Seiridium unicorne TaxID=138068 RepID=A0ABR2V0V4_9PEZI
MPSTARTLVQRIKDKLSGRSKKDKAHTGDSPQRSNGRAPDPTIGHAANSNRNDSAIINKLAGGSNNGTGRVGKTPEPRQNDKKITERPNRGSYDGLLMNEETPAHDSRHNSETGSPKIPRVPVGARSNRNSTKVEEQHEHDNTQNKDWTTSDPENEVRRSLSIDLTNTVDTDQTTTHRPAPRAAVVHETVRPHVHEIIEERIHRDIHTHDHYHYIQPVYELELLPARHFVPDPEGRLVEVSESDLPDCTGANQKWAINELEYFGLNQPTEESRLVGQAA